MRGPISHWFWRSNVGCPKTKSYHRPNIREIIFFQQEPNVLKSWYYVAFYNNIPHYYWPLYCIKINIYLVNIFFSNRNLLIRKSMITVLTVRCFFFLLIFLGLKVNYRLYFVTNGKITSQVVIVKYLFKKKYMIWYVYIL